MNSDLAMSILGTACFAGGFLARWGMQAIIQARREEKEYEQELSEEWPEEPAIGRITGDALRAMAVWNRPAREVLQAASPDAPAPGRHRGPDEPPPLRPPGWQQLGTRRWLPPAEILWGLDPRRDWLARLLWETALSADPRAQGTIWAAPV
jgi:hypothetical protein